MMRDRAQGAEEDDRMGSISRALYIIYEPLATPFTFKSHGRDIILHLSTSKKGSWTRRTVASAMEHRGYYCESIESLILSGGNGDGYHRSQRKLALTARNI